MVRQCHNHQFSNGNHTTYQNGDTWGMVTMALYQDQLDFDPEHHAPSLSGTKPWGSTKCHIKLASYLAP
jgi:hypothetical protein